MIVTLVILSVPPIWTYTPSDARFTYITRAESSGARLRVKYGVRFQLQQSKSSVIVSYSTKTKLKQEQKWQQNEININQKLD